MEHKTPGKIKDIKILHRLKEKIIFMDCRYGGKK
jgi:hypothetical protein